MTDPIESIITQLRQVQECLKAQEINLDPERFGLLAPFEGIVLQLAANGLSSREIGEKLKKNTRTIEGMRLNICAKLGCKNIAHAVNTAWKMGMLK